MRHLKGIKGYGDDVTIHLKISQCCHIVKKQAQDGKIKGIKQRAELENEEELLSKGTCSSSLNFVELLSLSLTISVVVTYIYIYISIYLSRQGTEHP